MTELIYSNALAPARLDPPLDCLLFGLLSRAVDPFWKKLFLKKTLLLLWKSLLVIHGGLDTLERRKNETRSSLGLPPKRTDFYPKVGPEDYDFYFHDMKKRYPNYLLPVPEPDLPTPPAFIRRQIAEYPSRLHPFVSRDGHLLPVAVRESLQIFNENMYKSHGSVQMARSQRSTSVNTTTNNSFAMDRIQVLYVSPPFPLSVYLLTSHKTGIPATKYECSYDNTTTPPLRTRPLLKRRSRLSNNEPLLGPPIFQNDN